MIIAEFLDSILEGIGKMIFLVIAVVGFFIFSNKFYFDVAIGLGIIILGILLLLLNGERIKGFLRLNKYKVFMVIEIAILICCMIWGFISPGFFMKIKFTRLFGIIAKTIIPSLILLVINMVLEDGFSGVVDASLGTLSIALISVAVALGIMMFFYFTKNETVLHFFADNCNYYNREYINDRKDKYGKNDFEYIFKEYTNTFKNNFSNYKQEYLNNIEFLNQLPLYANNPKAFSEEEFKKEAQKDFLEMFNLESRDYLGYSLEEVKSTKANANIKICVFKDNATINENYKLDMYYVKMNLEDYTLIEIKRNQKFDDELVK